MNLIRKVDMIVQLSFSGLYAFVQRKNSVIIIQDKDSIWNMTLIMARLPGALSEIHSAIFNSPSGFGLRDC